MVGTGGTISGIGQFLKSAKEDVLIVLADPEGSGLYNKVRLKASTDPTIGGSARGIACATIKFRDTFILTDGHPVLCGSGSPLWSRGRTVPQVPGPTRICLFLLILSALAALISFPLRFFEDVSVRTLIESFCDDAHVDRLSMVSCSIGGRQKERREDIRLTLSSKECEL